MRMPLESVTVRRQGGVTLIELIVFITVIALALGAMLGVYRYSVANSVDPLVRVRLLESTQSQLDVVLAQPYDANTPPGGVPACSPSNEPPPSGKPERKICADAGGVSQFDGVTDSPYPGYRRTVEIDFAGTELGLEDNLWAKRITVTTTAPGGESVTLSAYRTNF